MPLNHCLPCLCNNNENLLLGREYLCVLIVVLVREGPWKIRLGPGKVLEKSRNFIIRKAWEPWLYFEDKFYQIPNSIKFSLVGLAPVVTNTRASAVPWERCVWSHDIPLIQCPSDCFTLLLARHLVDVSNFVGPSTSSGICVEIYTKIMLKRKKPSHDEGIPRQTHVYL